MNVEERLPHGRISGATWCGHRCDARCVEVVVGPSDYPWCKDLTGQTRKAIEIKMGQLQTYVDNQDGVALRIFIRGIAPLPGMRFLKAFSVKPDPDADPFYVAQKS